jgi:hypothetical protein
VAWIFQHRSQLPRNICHSQFLRLALHLQSNEAIPEANNKTAGTIAFVFPNLFLTKSPSKTV